MDDPVIDGFVSGWDRHDGRAIAALMTADAVYEVVPQGRVFGPDKIEEQVGFMHSLSSDFSLRRVSAVHDGARHAVEWELTGTNDGPFEPFHLPPSGRRFTIRGAWFLRTAEGKVQHCRAYWDFASLLSQIGARPTGEMAWQLAVWAEEHPEGT